MNISPMENAYTPKDPLVTVPAEVFLWIISFLPAADPCSRKNLGWIKAAHVSRKWMALINNCATVWADNISDVLGPYWLTEMMNRSRTSALSVFLNPACLVPAGSQRIEDFILAHESILASSKVDHLMALEWTILQTHMPQIRSINLVLPAGPHDLGFLNIPAPILTHIVLQMPTPYRPPFLVSLPSSNLFPSASPIIKLIMHRLKPSWSYISLSTTITHLELRLSSEPEDIMCSLNLPADDYDMMCSALSNLVLLDVLILHGIFPLTISIPELRELNFTSLSLLDLKGLVHTCLDFISRTFVPPRCYTKVKCYAISEETLDLLCMKRVLCAVPTRTCVQVVASLQLESHFFKICNGHRRNVLHEEQSSQFEITLYHPVAERFLLPALDLLSGMNPHSLCLSDADELWVLETWSQFFELFPNLQVLHLHHTLTESFIENTWVSQFRMVLPNLNMLVCMDSNFRSKSLHSNVSHFKLLVEGLAARYENPEMPLLSVVVNETFDISSITRLREVAEVFAYEDGLWCPIHDQELLDCPEEYNSQHYASSEDSQEHWSDEDYSQEA